MRLLVLGAGGIGGYFGGRLAQSGEDVTFLVRAKRQASLRNDGLRIRSPLGDVSLSVATCSAERLPHSLAAAPFDLVLLSCKAYDLADAIEDIAPAVAAGAQVVPLLNGLRHYDALETRFGPASVAGGLCFISATLSDTGEVLHLGTAASMTFGERASQPSSSRLHSLALLCQNAAIDHHHTSDITQAQWNKYCFLTALAAGTCLMRASVGSIIATDGGESLMKALYAECTAVAAASAQPVPPTAQATAREVLTEPGSQMKASMLRDLEAGQRVEAAHIVGDMVHRAARTGVDARGLRAAWVHLQAYERARG